MREIGRVRAVQIQRESLKVGQKPDRRYDPAPLLAADRLHVSPDGVIGLLADGGQIIDVHHAGHPASRNNEVNPISVGFTGHYALMQAQFGPHMTPGIAGENILIEAEGRLSLADLGQRLAFENPASGEIIYLDMLMAAPPCAPFSQFALCQPTFVTPEQVKATLQFLSDGLRGFYGVPSTAGHIQPGDRVLAVD